jgi:hypothetical protein
MAASPQFATRLEYYLQTDFRPDCDYIDGQIVERNVGEKEHSFLQLKIAMLISEHERDWGSPSIRSIAFRSLMTDSVFPMFK